MFGTTLAMSTLRAFRLMIVLLLSLMLPLAPCGCAATSTGSGEPNLEQIRQQVVIFAEATKAAAGAMREQAASDTSLTEAQRASLVRRAQMYEDIATLVALGATDPAGALDKVLGLVAARYGANDPLVALTLSLAQQEIELWLRAQDGTLAAKQALGVPSS